MRVVNGAIIPVSANIGPTQLVAVFCNFSGGDGHPNALTYVDPHLRVKGTLDGRTHAHAIGILRFAIESNGVLVFQDARHVDIAIGTFHIDVEYSKGIPANHNITVTLDLSLPDVEQNQFFVDDIELNFDF